MAAVTLTPRELLDMTDAFSSALRLLLLDRVWTREAQRASDPKTNDPGRVADLDVVVDEMDTLLHHVRDVAPGVAATATRTGLLQQRFDELMKEAPPRGVEADRLRTITGRLRHHVTERTDGDAARYVAEAADTLAARADTEIDAIRTELDRVRGRKPSDGDMSEETQEAVGAIALGAGLMFGPEAAGAVIVVAEVVDCLFG